LRPNPEEHPVMTTSSDRGDKRTKGKLDVKMHLYVTLLIDILLSLLAY
jgi:hypothetical protein